MSERDKLLADLMRQEEIKRAFFPDTEHTMQQIHKSLQGLRPNLDAFERLKIGFPTSAIESLSISHVDLARAMQSHIQEMTRAYQHLQFPELREHVFPNFASESRRLLEENSRNLAIAFRNTGWNATLTDLAPRLELAKSVALNLSRIATTWSDAMLHARLPLFEMALQNVAALESLEVSTLARYIEPERLVVERMRFAGEFVSSNAAFVRGLPADRIAKEKVLDDGAGHEELRESLAERLALVDPRLAELRRQAWRNLKDGTAGARLAEHAIREIMTELLHLFAPDAEVMKSEVWAERKDSKLTRPTRKMRFRYIVGPSGDEVAAVLQFDDSIRLANKYAHTFPEEVALVRAHLIQFEACVDMLLTYILERLRC
jgi:hypothetical protein